MVKKLPLAVGILLVLTAGVLLVLALFKNELFPEYSPSQRGLQVAQKSGCLNCHVGFDGRGATNPRQGGGVEQVPNFFTERHGLDGIRQWIRNGISDARRRRQEAAEREGRRREREAEALVMPAFGKQLSDSQIDDLVSYVALTQYGQNASRGNDLPQGEAVARRYACYTCHGELGQGGVGNPGSLKGYIPGFFGDDFRALTRNGNRQDIREWIQSGHSEFFWNQGFAGFFPGRFFTERQAIRMPEFRALVSDDEMEPLIDHLIELMHRGPLDAEALLAFRPLPERRHREPDGDRPDRPDASARAVEGLPETFLAARSVLEEHCVKCHGPAKQKSRYRLDRRQSAFAGGELVEATGEAAIAPGNSEKSLIYQYVTATEEDPFKEIHPMPPDGNPRLSASEIELLRRWIDAGAPWPEGVELEDSTHAPKGNNE